jgi:integrase
MVLLMRYTGLRISDVVTLDRSHIHGDYLVKRLHKNGRLIRVKLPQEVLEALERLPKPKGADQDSTLLFASGRSSLRSLVKGAERTLAAVFRRSGVVGAHAHRFRHTLASELLGRGGAIEDVAAILGDSPAVVRRHYAKWTPDQQARLDSTLSLVRDTSMARRQTEVCIC